MRALRKLLPFLKPHRLHVAVVFLCAVGATATNLAGPWFIRSLIGLLEGGEGWSAVGQEISWLVLALAGAFVFRAGFVFLVGYLAHIVAWSFVSDVTVALYDHLQRQSLRYFSDRQTGEMLPRLIKDTTDMEPFVAHDLPDLVMNALTLVGITAIFFSLDPVLAALTLLPMPFLAIFVLSSGSRMHSAFESARERFGSLSALLQDNLSGIKEIQVFNGEPVEHRRVEGRARRHVRDRLAANRIEAVYSPGVELIAGAGLVIVAFFGGRAALTGSLAVGDLVAFILYLGLFYEPLRQLAHMSESFHEALTGARHVCEVLGEEPEVKDPPRGKDPGRTRGEATLENVEFGYDPDQPVLRDLSLKVEPGQTVALVGPTGAGKSTVAGLIPRFHDPLGGRVLIDGTDVREMRLGALRRNVSMVLQDTFLFHGTLRENLRLGNRDATDEELESAATTAGADEFIRRLPEGYDTEIGERGVRLSGGQKQRLAIARAVLKDAPILILDEATSAVDTETEARIQEALGKLMEGRTAIVIAHRLSTIRNADKIAVLEDGAVAELGDHDELMALNGLYRRLHDRQFGAAA